MDAFALLRRLITRAHPETRFHFDFGEVDTEDGGTAPFLRVRTDTFVFTVSRESRWTDVQRILAKKMAPTRDECCAVCCEAMRVRVSCNVCSQETCAECYVRTFVANSGVIVCPFCRSRTGRRMSPAEVEAGVACIRSRLPPA